MWVALAILTQTRIQESANTRIMGICPNPRSCRASGCGKSEPSPVVPLEANSAKIAQRYEQLGGQMTLEDLAGQGHNMWPGWFESEKLVEFVVTNAIAPTNKPR